MSVMDASGFIQALVDDPEDEATLPVFADWLEEHDDPRAELIRIQAALRQWHPEPEHRAALQARERQLLGQLRESWLGPLGNYCASWVVRDGLAAVSIEARRFVGKHFGTKAETWLKDAWVHTLHLKRPAAHVERIAATPALKSVTSLDLAGGQLDDDDVAQILASPHLGMLRELDLSNNGLTDNTVDHLISSRVLGKLRWLSLRNNNLTDVGTQALLTALEDKPLRRLDLHGNLLSRSMVELVSDWKRRRPMRHVTGRPVYLYGPLGMGFRLIPAGTFLMGSPPDEEGRLDDELQHRVTLTRPFYLSVFQVTQQQYEWLMGSNPSRHPPSQDGGLAHPVENLPWQAAVAFCKALSERATETEAKRVYRLPTEAEWEHAARAGNALGDPYPMGPTMTIAEANYTGGHRVGDSTSRHARRVTSPVGSYQPTGWGLFDMAGNVWEWCADWFSGSYYATSPALDPTGPEGDSGHRSVRGGSHFDPGVFCRCGVRGRIGPDAHHDGLGFRVALSC